MSHWAKKFHSVESLTSEEALQLFQSALQLKGVFNRTRSFSDFFKSSPEKIVSCLFFESSTRTRFSFETAIARLGHRSLVLSSKEGTSIDKGESVIETTETLLAMKPDAMVIRYGQSEMLDSYLKEIRVPWVNAGSGVSSHPTQALLDALTIYERFQSFENLKLVFVGDVLHSRVANSNLNLLSKLGVEVAVCAPQYLLPNAKAWEKVKTFEKLEEALSWADICMGLRVQKERHQPETMSFFENYVSDFCITNKKLSFFKKNGIVMHPGPFVPNEDLSPEVLSDSRCKLRNQVENGVYMRAIVMAKILGMEMRS